MIRPSCQDSRSNRITPTDERGQVHEQEHHAERQEPANGRQVRHRAGHQLTGRPSVMERDRQFLQVVVDGHPHRRLDPHRRPGGEHPPHPEQRGLDDAETEQQAGQRPERRHVLVRDRTVDDLPDHQREGQAAEHGDGGGDRAADQRRQGRTGERQQPQQRSDRPDMRGSARRGIVDRRVGWAGFGGSGTDRHGVARLRAGTDRLDRVSAAARAGHVPGPRAYHRRRWSTAASPRSGHRSSPPSSPSAATRCCPMRRLPAASRARSGRLLTSDGRWAVKEAFRPITEPDIRLRRRLSGRCPRGGSADAPRGARPDRESDRAPRRRPGAGERVGRSAAARHSP